MRVNRPEIKIFGFFFFAVRFTLVTTSEMSDDENVINLCISCASTDLFSRMCTRIQMYRSVNMRENQRHNLYASYCGNGTIATANWIRFICASEREHANSAYVAHTLYETFPPHLRVGCHIFIYVNWQRAATNEHVFDRIPCSSLCAPFDARCEPRIERIKSSSSERKENEKFTSAYWTAELNERAEVRERPVYKWSAMLNFNHCALTILKTKSTTVNVSLLECIERNENQIVWSTEIINYYYEMISKRRHSATTYIFLCFILFASDERARGRLVGFHHFNGRRLCEFDLSMALRFIFIYLTFFFIRFHFIFVYRLACASKPPLCFFGLNLNSRSHWIEVAIK